MIGKLKSVYKRFFRKKICRDCQVKLDRHFGLKSKIKHRLHKIRHGAKHRASKSKHKLRAGVHWVKVKGGKKRKVRVLANGQWRFMKSR